MYINKYQIKYNRYWKKWQVSHSDIGNCIAEFNNLSEALNYATKG